MQRSVKRSAVRVRWELEEYTLGLRSDLDGSAAEIFIDAVRNGKNRAPRRRTAQRFKNARFGFGIQVCRNLVEQQHSGVCRRSAGNGQQLPLALREHPLHAHRIIALRKRLHGGVDTGQLRRVFRHRRCDLRVSQRNLVQDRARHAGKMLLHAANTGPSLLI